MSPRGRTYLRFVIAFGALGTLGLLATVYLLAQQSASSPFRDVYTLSAEFSEANGATAGIGQPVNVAGVKVGQVTEVELVAGRALVSFEIERDQLPRVHADATAVLEPITPLKDMQIHLDPGRPSSGVLGDGGTISVERTNPPVELADLMTALDSDTRSFMTGLIGSLDRGTQGRGPDFNRFLAALGPTAREIGLITRELEGRRRELADLVHNLALVSRAAARDEQLSAVVASGSQTLAALAEQDRPLRDSLDRLPATLATTRSVLENLEPVSRQLVPTLDALEPAIERLPATLEAMGPFAQAGADVLRDELRPLIREAQPLLGDLGAAVPDLSAATPYLSSTSQVFNYLGNELAYNPEGDDEGFLFWAAWLGHNLNSTASTGDAHGALLRAMRFVSCEGINEIDGLAPALAVGGLCP